MEEFVYRIRRKSDGHWYGKKPRFSKEYFHPIAGKTMSRHAVLTTLKGWSEKALSEIEVIEYRIVVTRSFTFSELDKK